MALPRSRGGDKATKRGKPVNPKVNRRLMLQSQWQQIGSMQFGPRGDLFKKSPSSIRQQ
jgi:hypothetical protein